MTPEDINGSFGLTPGSHKVLFDLTDDLGLSDFVAVLRDYQDQIIEEIETNLADDTPLPDDTTFTMKVYSNETPDVDIPDDTPQPDPDSSIDLGTWPEYDLSADPEDPGDKKNGSQHFYPEIEAVGPWTRVFARDLRRVLDEVGRPITRGNYESGKKLNSTSLHRMQVGDNRIQKRNKTRRVDPVEFLMAYDESSSIRGLPRWQQEAYRRTRWMLCEGLAVCEQDFALMGWGQDQYWYKHLGQPYDDRVRGKLVSDASERMGMLASSGCTRTWAACEELRKEHERNDPRRRRIGLLLTDGQPYSPHPRDRQGLPSYGLSTDLEKHWRGLVREQVELAQTERLTIIGVVLALSQKRNSADPRIRAHTHEQRAELITKLDDMFPRVIVLADTQDEIEMQLTKTVVDLARK